MYFYYFGESDIPLTTFEEEIYLRVLTGRLVGKALADLGVNKLTVMAPRNIISSSSIAAATGASFLDYTGGVTYYFLLEGNGEDIARGLRGVRCKSRISTIWRGDSDRVDKEEFCQTIKSHGKRGGSRKNSVPP